MLRLCFAAYEKSIETKHLAKPNDLLRSAMEIANATVASDHIPRAIPKEVLTRRELYMVRPVLPII